MNKQILGSKMQAKSIGFYCLWGIVTGSMFVVIPLYTSELSFNVYQISIFVAIPNVTLLLQPVWALLIDYCQRPKQIVLYATLTAALALVLLAFADSFATISISYLIYSIFINPMWTIIDNLIFGQASSEGYKYERLRCFASYFYGLSVLVVSPLLLVISTNYYFIGAALMYGAIVVIISQMPSPKLSSNKLQRPGLGALHKLATSKYLVFIVFACFYGALLPLSIPYQTLLIVDLNYGLGFLALATLLTTLFEGLMMERGARLYRRVGLKRALGTSVMLLVLRSTILYSQSSAIAILVACGLYGLSTSIYIPVLMNYINQIVGLEYSNLGLLIISFTTSLVAVLVSVLASSYIDMYSIRIFYLINIGMLLLGLVVIPFLKSDEGIDSSYPES